MGFKFSDLKRIASLRRYLNRRMVSIACLGYPDIVLEEYQIAQILDLLISKSSLSEVKDSLKQNNFPEFFFSNIDSKICFF